MTQARLSLCAALALCAEAIEPGLDVGDAKPIKPQRTDLGLDVVLTWLSHVACVSGARFGATVTFSHDGGTAELSAPCLVTTCPRGFPSELRHRLCTI